MNLTSELQRLRDQDMDLALILDTFAAIDHAYQQSLEAMGQANPEIPSVKNSAEITLSVNSSVSTASQLVQSENN